jgi:hypothetical protein
MTDIARPEPRKRLFDFDFSEEGAEISLVDKAANGHKFLMLKAAPASEEEKPVEVVEEKDAEEVTKNLSTLMGILGQLLGNPEQQQQAAPVTQQNGFDVELGKFLAYLTDQVRQSAPESPSPHRVNESTQYNPTPATMYLTEKSEENEMPLEDVIKSEEGQKFINELVEKAIDGVKKENEDLKKSLKFFQEEQEVLRSKQFVEVAKSLGSLGFTEEHGNLLKSICDKSPEEYQQLSVILEKASKISKSEDMFQEVGTAAEGDSDQLIDGLPKNIVLMANELQKADKSLTRPQAVAKAYKSR